MLIGRFTDEHPLLAQESDDVGVRIEDIFAGKLRETGFVRVATVVVHRREDLQSVLAA